MTLAIILDLEPHLDSPEQLEREYREHPEAFTRALRQLDSTHTSNLLVRAWKARLLALAPESKDVAPAPVNWRLVAALAICAGVAARVLSGGVESDARERAVRFGAFVVLVPIGLLLWSSLARSATRRDALLGLAALIAVPFAGWTPMASSQSGYLAIAHLPVLLGTLVFGVFACDPQGKVSDRAEFVTLAAEVAILCLALLFAGALLTGLTIGVFSLIKLDIAEFYVRNVAVPCAAAAPIVATGLERARAQRGERLGPSLARVFSPLVLVTLIAYLLAVIGTRNNPYRDRNSLAMLFAMLLATGVLVTLMVLHSRNERLSPRVAAIGCAICSLAVLVDAIALSAIVYRFASFGFSPNRVAVLGGNLLLFCYLCGLAVALARAAGPRRDALAAMHWIGSFLPVFGIWAALWVFVLPALFGFR